jgi:hypothetical protein
VRDARPSSGAWALAITLALSIRNPKLRIGVTTLALAFLVAMLVEHHRMFDLQHLLLAPTFQ